MKVLIDRTGTTGAEQLYLDTPEKIHIEFVDMLEACPISEEELKEFDRLTDPDGDLDLICDFLNDMEYKYFTEMHDRYIVKDI